MPTNLTKEPPIVIVAAMSRTRRAIGNNNQLLWHIPADLQRFKKLTTGHPIIMGRKTFDSIIDILGTPLPGRTNIIVTRDTNFTYPDVTVTHSLDTAIAAAKNEAPAEIHIGGGAEIYRQALPHTDRLHITWIDDEPEADTFFPDFAADFDVVTEHEVMHHNTIAYQWVDYVRK